MLYIADILRNIIFRLFIQIILHFFVYSQSSNEERNKAVSILQALSCHYLCLLGLGSFIIVQMSYSVTKYTNNAVF